MVFQWYLVPAVFASYFLFAEGLGWLLKKVVGLEGGHAHAFIIAPVLVLLGAANLFILGLRTERYTQLQQYEEHLREEIGLWLKSNAAPGSRVLLEPLGYIGYYAGPDLKIEDELGLVAPKVLEFRKSGPGWYCQALAALQSDFVIQYSYSIDYNIAEGTQDRLFADDDEREWFLRNYEAVRIFDVSSQFPSIESKEKKFVLFRKVKDPTSPLPTEMKKGGFAGEILRHTQISRKFRMQKAFFSGHVGIP